VKANLARFTMALTLLASVAMTVGAGIRWWTACIGSSRPMPGASSSEWPPSPATRSCSRPGAAG